MSKKSLKFEKSLQFIVYILKGLSEIEFGPESLPRRINN